MTHCTIAWGITTFGLYIHTYIHLLAVPFMMVAKSAIALFKEGGTAHWWFGFVHQKRCAIGGFISGKI
jgi:hypothetical protein